MKRSKKKNEIGVTVAPETGITDRLSYQVANLQGVGSRERQEDSFTLVNSLDELLYNDYGLMFAVCDGMGGMKDGKIASEAAINSLRNFFAGMDRSGQIAKQLKGWIPAVSEEVVKYTDGDGGSTVVVGVIFHEQLYFASLGDSSLYLKRNENLYRLNVEQNICHQLYLEHIRDGLFDPKACRENQEAEALVQFLGMPEISDVDGSVRPMYLQRGDTILVCSDGVSGVLDNSEIIDALCYQSGQDACRQIEQCIIKHANPNQDNYTALIIKCE